MIDEKNIAADVGESIRAKASRLKDQANALAKTRTFGAKEVLEVGLPELKQMALDILAETIIWENMLKSEM